MSLSARCRLDNTTGDGEKDALHGFKKHYLQFIYVSHSVDKATMPFVGIKSFEQ